jgi:hypothetical protein
VRDRQLKLDGVVVAAEDGDVGTCSVGGYGGSFGGGGWVELARGAAAELGT